MNVLPANLRYGPDLKKNNTTVYKQIYIDINLIQNRCMLKCYPVNNITKISFVKTKILDTEMTYIYRSMFICRYLTSNVNYI